MPFIQNLIAVFFFRAPSTDSPTKPNLSDDNASETSLSPTPTYRWRYFLINFLTLLLSAASILAIFVLLRQHQDLALPLWRQNITINTVISYLSALAKLTLVVPLAECIGQAKWRLFSRGRRKLSDLELADGAGRDAFGAIWWILRFRGGVLVHFGAALVIASLAFDPAMQHLVRYDLVGVVDAGASASLAVNTDYSPVRGLDRGLVFATPKAVLAGAYSSVLGAGIPASYACPSGNCTFPSTATISLCSSCTDITRSLVCSCRGLTSKNPFCVSRGTCYTTGQICSYRDSVTNATVGGEAGVFLDLVAPGVDFKPTGDGNISISRNIVNLTALFISPRGEPDLPDTGTIFETRLPIAPGHVSAKTGEHKARAFSCLLSYCEQHVSATVIAGALHESSTLAPDTFDSLTMRAPDITEITDALFSSKIPLTRSNSTRVSVAAIFALAQGMSASLTGNSTQPDTSTPEPYISEFHRAMYESLLSTEFPDLITSMASSMGNAIRNDGATTEKGSVWVQRMLLRVDWIWTTLPATVWFGVLLLLVVVTYQSRKDHAPWLGTSQLAGVYIALEQEVREEVNGRDGSWGDRGGMMKVAEEERKVRVAPMHGLMEGRPSMKFTSLRVAGGGL
ncbi:hypothetical protein K440DRAFT_658588 [Wilcoxina mikolae CBS 423.85]|nr:hypothetical protein K440DRAFT_658588 [Wilcoxina mikolae CBS 423.85]